jgi:hypothetical protein
MDACFSSLGCRTLDLIHVAAALVIGAKEFVTRGGSLLWT